MPDEWVNRRRLLAASLGAAATLPLVASSPPMNRARTGASEAARSDVSAARNVRDFGAVGDGRADDTEAIARACRAGEGPVVLYLPAGTYLVTQWPELPDFSTVTGDGGDVSTIVYEGDGTLISLRDRQRVALARLGIYVTGPGATAVRLSGSFRCSFDSVVLRGNHLSDNHPRFTGQRGVVLERNTGGTAFLNCDINNFGIGIVTSCIQNFVTSSKLTNNHTGVLGTGNDYNAGLSLTNVEFVSDRDPRTTQRHIYIDGAANDWWLTNVWFEGADTALTIGRRDHGGPSQLGLVNCKIAARRLCLDLVHCRQPYLANVRFDPDTDPYPIELRIDPEGCPEGTAVNLVSSAAFEVDPATFPHRWNVMGRSRMSGPELTGRVVARATEGEDLLQAQGPDGRVLSAILPSGAWLAERADTGPILRDENGIYWRVTVSTDGELKTESLGDLRPRA
ncbi:glycoside hydrolase family 55 protein [Knoellia sp. 3-2P3]|uniref:glycoside hydrolase family 55 protein n=1 Tax=unclassified Knoellia TaxID=2618719 RepID=UPI0023DB8470|nr:glycoside hydrolase family 55 protein [Knoellia sp. 3-2P3]MDF2091182.1 glycoside hydrolase family 55 protein [Knoellia sp. 3-2P3]